MSTMILKLESKNPTLEFSAKTLCPNPDKFRFKIAHLLGIFEEAFQIKHLDSLDWLYHEICVTLNTLKILYDNKYEFHHKQSAFTSGIWIYYENRSNKNTIDHIIHLMQRFNNIKQIGFTGEYLDLEVFNSIKCILQSSYSQSLKFHYKQKEENRMDIDELIELPLIYLTSIKNKDYTEIQLPSIKLIYYNK